MQSRVRGSGLRAAGAALLAAVALTLGGCATGQAPAPAEEALAAVAPAAPREFRAMWVASVANIDWPSRPGLSVEQQRAEMIALLERARELNLNAVILQVRPAADALYPSRLEPWSEFLTGEQGRAPEPYYDPLRAWIDEAHRRGLELHAWLNPYRARSPAAKGPLARLHLARAHPSAVKAYGDLLWMDPGDKYAAAQTLGVVRDLVRRYDLDGIHIDDYFYPYPKPEVGDFPDDASWQRYVKRGGRLARDDWRRQNVDRLIEAMYRSIHDAKPWVRFGVSPFGIGRPDRRPSGITGFSQYDKLYADVEKWLAEGWLDYLAPQLYWRIDQKAQSFPVLLDYWRQHNPAQRHIWPGLNASSVDRADKGWSPEELGRQIALMRAAPPTPPDSLGQIHFSAKALLQDRAGLATYLRRGPYAQPALVPVSPWMKAEPMRAPTLVRETAPAEVVVVRASRFGPRPTHFAVWRRYAGGTWRFAVVPAAERVIALGADAELGAPDAIVVSAVDRLGNESPRVACAITPVLHLASNVPSFP
ncbi:hypothetical protein DB354_20330 [Opitutus sp. ER46]|nr:hypothetical protein DB354_20330 [Opitutus sp. ER46]